MKWNRRLSCLLRHPESPAVFMLEKNGYWALPAIRPCCTIQQEANLKIMRKFHAQFGPQTMLGPCHFYQLHHDYESEESVFEVFDSTFITRNESLLNWVDLNRLRELKLSDEAHREVIQTYLSEKPRISPRIAFLESSAARELELSSEDLKSISMIHCAKSFLIFRIEKNSQIFHVKIYHQKNFEPALLTLLAQAFPDAFPKPDWISEDHSSMIWKPQGTQLTYLPSNPRTEFSALLDWYTLQKRLQVPDILKSGIAEFIPSKALKQCNAHLKEYPEWQIIRTPLETLIQTLDSLPRIPILQHGNLDRQRIFSYQDSHYYSGLEEAYLGLPGSDLLRPFMKRHPFFDQLSNGLFQLYPELEIREWQTHLKGILTLSILRSLTSILDLQKWDDARFDIAVRENLNLLKAFTEN